MRGGEKRPTSRLINPQRRARKRLVKKLRRLREQFRQRPADGVFIHVPRCRCDQCLYGAEAVSRAEDY